MSAQRCMSIAAFVLLTATGRVGQTQGCLPLSTEVRGRLGLYVASRYEFAPDIRVAGQPWAQVAFEGSSFGQLSRSGGWSFTCLPTNGS